VFLFLCVSLGAHITFFSTSGRIHTSTLRNWVCHDLWSNVFQPLNVVHLPFQSSLARTFRHWHVAEWRMSWCLCRPLWAWLCPTLRASRQGSEWLLRQLLFAQGRWSTCHSGRSPALIAASISAWSNLPSLIRPFAVALKIKISGNRAAITAAFNGSMPSVVDSPNVLRPV